jgi:Tetratricopeptide repeat
MKKVVLIVISIFFTIQLFSQQTNDYRLGIEYYKSKEYDKALFYFEKLTNQRPNTSTYFDYYIRCLTQLEDYKTAEKEIKKRIRKDKNNYQYYIELGALYEAQDQSDKANEQFETALNTIRPDQHYVIRMANAFRVKRENQYAEKTYLQGRKILKGAYTFNFELGNLYYYLRNYEKMINEYLDMLLVSEAYIQNVQNRLQNAVYNDIDNSLTGLLKDNLLKRTQRYPDKTVFNELLIWLFVQEKDFEGAFIQAKALDKRLKESGERIVALARMAANNEDFPVAISAYEYVIEKGKVFEYYYPARKEFLEVLYVKVLSSSNIDVLVIENLEQSIQNFLNDFGKDNLSSLLAIKLAHLQAFYLNKADEAVKLLETYNAHPSIQKENIALINLELADIFVLQNNVFDATLLYAKIEEENKNNPNGYEAKFRRARLAYYIGNFEWAKALLDVLKASTSKLIANDAFGISLLINDNTFNDSIEYPLQLFADADLLTYQNKDSLALMKLDTLKGKYFSHSLIDEVLFKESHIHLKRKKYDLASQSLELILKDFSYDILADDAAFLLAQVYEQHLNNPERAKELYQQILIDFPSSIYVVQARQRFRTLRGDLP